MIVVAAYLMITSSKDRTEECEGAYNLWLGAGISLGVGFLSSLLGIGGGIIHVPALTHALNFPVHSATATSHFVLAITALIATTIHFANGTLDGQFETILWISFGAITGAQAGAKLSNRLQGSWILRGLAVGLGLIGVRVLLQLF